MWNKKAQTCGYCPADIGTCDDHDADDDACYASCEDIIVDWGWTCQEVIDAGVPESWCSQCPSCDITADDGDGGDACSGLARKKCKKTAGCAYKKKTCVSCSELPKGKCKKTAGCAYKKKQCSAASSCSGLSKRECKTTDGCKYKKKKDKCLAK